jgi:hypothetical protein
MFSLVTLEALLLAMLQGSYALPTSNAGHISPHVDSLSRRAPVLSPFRQNSIASSGSIGSKEDINLMELKPGPDILNSQGPVVKKNEEATTKFIKSRYLERMKDEFARKKYDSGFKVVDGMVNFYVKKQTASSAGRGPEWEGTGNIDEGEFKYVERGFQNSKKRNAKLPIDEEGLLSH